MLARHFLAVSHRETGTVPRDFSEDALACLAAYGWPGNIRELRNAVQSAAIMAEGDIVRSSDLPASIQAARPDQSPQANGNSPTHPLRSGRLAEALEAVERRLIAEVLAQEGGNRSRAAECLGITRKTLQAKIAQYKL